MKRLRSAAVITWMRASASFSWLTVFPPHDVFVFFSFNSSEKRLARTLLLLARYGKQDQPQKMVAKVSQEMLAEMIGTTRSRVNFFMNKFRKLGFIHYNGGLHVHNSLLSVVLHE